MLQQEQKNGNKQQQDNIMAILSKKEFSALAGIKSNQLSVHIDRGQVLVREDGQIDTFEDKNILFIEKRKSKSQSMQDAEPSPFVQPSPKQRAKSYEEIESEGEDADEDSNGIPSLTTSERKKKHLETIKIAQEIELLKLREEKLKGIVVPSELIKPLFLQHNQSIVSEFKNTADEIIRTIGKRKSLNANEMAEIKGELVKIINVSIGKATKASVKAVDIIINDFSDTRGKGERKN